MGERPYKKLFLLATEGGKTEPAYFSLFNDDSMTDASVLHVRCLNGKHKSSPPHVLKRMTAFLRDEKIRPSDEAWVIIDKDQWTDQQIDQLHQWTQGNRQNFLALSNPKFEYWLLLHYEDGQALRSSRECTERLKGWIPGYDKGLRGAKINPEQIDAAIRRAKTRDNPPCKDWPKTFGQTTVYRLVENIRNSQP
nr:RloB family protein [Pelodictyon luteolum]